MNLQAGTALAAPPFVGRGRHLALLAEVFAEAAAGRPRVVLVEGEAGIGKSALLARAIAELSGGDAVVLRAVGDEAESALQLGIVGQLVAGLSPLPSELSAVLDGSGERGPLAAGVGLLALLGQLQDRGPVVVVVDDAYWSDSASLQALAFCLRRLRADRVVALLAARTEELDRLPRGLTALARDPTGITVSLAGLEPGELAELAAALGAGVLAPRAAERLARHAGGSPLLATALLEEFGASPLEAPDALERHAPRSFSSVVLARLAGCAQRGRELATAGCVLGLSWPLELAAELAGVDDPLAAADEAADARLIAVEHGEGPPRGGFQHPLVRAALYQELPLARRAALHKAAAALVGDPRDALRHRVEAEIGTNPELAAELVAMAERDAAAGSWAAAARAYLRAARVAPGRTERERHTLDAAGCLLLAGDVGQARALVEEASQFLDGAPLHFARGYLAWTEGAFDRAERELRAAWELTDTATDGALAARAADLLSSLCVYLGRGSEGIDWAYRSLEAHPYELPGANPRTSLLVGYGISGRAEEGLAEAARLSVERASSRPVDGLVGRCTLRLWADDPLGAREDLLELAETCLRRGPLDRGMFAAVHLADAEWRLGLWDEALLHAEAGVSAATAAAHGWFVAQAHAAATLPLAARGEWEAAEAHARGAVEAARRVGHGHGTLWAIIARARLADARGDRERVVRALTPLLRFIAADGVDHPGIHSWRELLGAALVAVGRVEEAAEHADALERQAQRLGVDSARAGSLRLRGLIATAAGRQDAAIRSFERALAEYQSLTQPFGRALLEADLGACLRRAGDRRLGADRLRRAEATLAGLGAAPYLTQVEQELAACGNHPARDGAGARQRLTPAELSVARLVANGRSNREAAAELVLSVKTIEHHLGRIYRKLGISSRTQLAVHLSEH
jgi:DNA-binding CsgD family transcriptional regulator